MFTHTETEELLYKAVVADPHDDLPRKMYCDELEQNAGGYCPDCKNTGWERPDVERCGGCLGGAPSDGRAERAEFIRTQIALHDDKGHEPPADLLALHASDDGGMSYLAAGQILSAKREHDARHERLARRDDVLFRAHAGDWFLRHLLGSVATRCGRGITWVGAVSPVQRSGTAARFEGVVVRGFVGEVRCQRLTDWVGVACELCGGSYDGRLSGATRACDRCASRGRLSRFGRELVRRHPLTRVTVGDREPYAGSELDRGFWWVHEAHNWANDVRLLRGTLPAFLWCHPKISTGEPGRRTAVVFETAELAVDALSDALLDFARGET